MVIAFGAANIGENVLLKKIILLFSSIKTATIIP